MPVAIEEAPCAVEIDRDLDVGFLGGALDGRLAHVVLRGSSRVPFIRALPAPPIRPPPPPCICIAGSQLLNHALDKGFPAHAISRIRPIRPLARHHHSDRPQGRDSGGGRRRAGLDRPDHRQGQRQKGSPARQGRGDRRLRRRHGRRLYAVRAAGSQARAISRPAHARGGGAGQGLAHRPLFAPAGSDDDRRRQGRVAWCSPAPATCSSRKPASSASAPAAITRSPRRVRLPTGRSTPRRSCAARSISRRISACIPTNIRRNVIRRGVEIG